MGEEGAVGAREVGLRALPLGIGAEQPEGRIGAEDAGGQVEQAVGGGRARLALRCTATERVEEAGGLYPLGLAGGTAERARDQQRHVQREAPEARMDQRVHALHPHQRAGTQRRDPPRAVLGQPLPREGIAHQPWQQQRPRPYPKPRAQTPQRPAPVGPRPVECCDQRGQHLRHACERRQTDGGEPRALGGQHQVERAQAQDAQHGQPPAPQQEAAHVPARAHLHHARADRERGDDVIGDHRGQRDGADDHHRRGRAEPADEGEQRQVFPAQRDGHGQDVHVRVGAGRQQRRAHRKDRQDREAHQQQVEREGPGGGAQVALIRVLHHRYLELARQAQDRGAAQQDQPRPARAERVLALRQRLGEARGHVRRTSGRGDQREAAHRDQRAELDRRLHRDGRDHARVALVRVEAAGAEQDGEEGEPGRRPQRRAPHRPRRGGLARQVRGGGGRADHLHARRDRLELQRDIGCRRHQHPQRHQRPHRVRAPVAQRDQVGDGGRAARVPDPQQPAQHGVEAEEDQCGPEIDGRELHPAPRRRAHGPEEGPRGAIDRQRERVGQRRVEPAAPPARRRAVRAEGDGEEQRRVGERHRQHRARAEPLRAHRRLSTQASVAAPAIIAIHSPKR